MSTSIAIVSDDPGWHGKRLTQAFQDLGCSTRYVRLQDARIVVGDVKADIKLPGFEQLPDGVFVRGVPGGTLEEVMHYLDILHALETLGVPVINNTRCIERSVDKAMTSFLLKHAGLPTPATWVGSDVHAAYGYLREGLKRGQEYVIKPIFGSQGKGLRHIQRIDQIEGLDEYSGVFYIQEFIPTEQNRGTDWRVFITGSRAIAAMRREGTSWISNVAHGAKCISAQLESNLVQLAVDAAKVLSMDYAGVDLMRDREGKFWVTEVNSVPAWKGLQSVTEFSIADEIAQFFLHRLYPERKLSVPGA